MNAKDGGFQSTTGSSWADQWDYGHDPAQAPVKPKSSTGDKVAKTKKAAAAAGEKAKAAASVGFKKAKVGAVLGFNWIKDKYNSTKKNGGRN